MSIIWKRFAVGALGPHVADAWEGRVANQGPRYMLICGFTELTRGLAIRDVGFTAYAIDRDGDLSRRLAYSPSLSEAKAACATIENEAAATRRETRTRRALRALAYAAFRYGRKGRPVSLANVRF